MCYSNANNFVLKSIINCGNIYKRYSDEIKKTFNILFLAAVLITIYEFRDVILEALQMSIKIGYMVLFIPLLFLVWNYIATIGWAGLLKTASSFRHGVWELYLIRIQCQTLNLILPLCGMGGEALRSIKTANEKNIKESTFCVALDKSADVSSEALLAVIGLLLASKLFPFPFAVETSAIVCLVVLSVMLFAWKSVWSIIWRFWPLKRGKNTIVHISNNDRLKGAYWRAFSFHFIEHVLIAGEIFTIAYFLGVKLHIRELLIVNAITSVSTLIFLFVPGRIGAFECSLAFGFNLLSLSTTAGLSVAIIRRARQVLVCMIGAILLVTQRKKLDKSKTPLKKMDNEEQTKNYVLVEPINHE